MASAEQAGPSAVSPSAPGQAPAARACPKCAAAMAPGQDWCLQCGSGAPEALGGGWRPAAWVLGLTVLLLLGAAAAGYAALTTKAPTAPLVTRTVAAAPPATTPVAPATTPPTTSVPLVKPPKIPLTTPTPSSTATTPATTPATTTETTKTTSTTETKTGGTGSAEPTPILLDTDAASTYNPYNLPASYFGDPSLTIDGDTSTAWTAEVNPATAPTMAEGLLVNLKSPQKLQAVKLVTSTPGMTVQLFGTTATTAPDSITSHEWVALSHSVVLHKKHAHIALLHKTKAVTLVTLWISKAPASAVGTPEAPAHVSVNEIELFPAS